MLPIIEAIHVIGTIMFTNRRYMLARTFSAAAAVLLVAGCATPPMNADRVTVIQGSNAFTSNCKMLGPVSDSVSAWKFASYQHALQQVIWNMQAQAFERYGADTISIQNAGNSLGESFGQAVALKCYG